MNFRYMPRLTSNKLMKMRLWVGKVYGSQEAGLFLDQISFKQSTLVVQVGIKLLGGLNSDVF